ncbi:hypothetical protein MNBD_GAMMA05-1499 [hydrothermal vent metagenome]|uniref:Uncharacterized protein n=1 Tax=hydrothermal vent metagenome TaxID=652676 RepID=A0A3B0WGQ2_9ZZZZ
MKKIGRDIKKILSGLSYQNAGDFLSRKEKLVLLGHEAARQTGNVIELNSQVHVVDAQSSEKTAA